MAKATGIGGVFFKCDDPDKMREWYGEHLGLKTNQYGALFEFRAKSDPEKLGYLQWSTFSQTTKYLEPSDSSFMVNYRVDDLEAMLEQMKSAGVEIIGEVQSFEYGKFAHVMDPEGNKIELWEPIDSVFTAEYQDTTNHE